MPTPEVVPDIALPFGFSRSLSGTHTSRTIMLQEVILLFEASPIEADHPTLRSLVIEENVTLKSTLSTRKKTFRHLVELYGLRREQLIFRALRQLWAAAPEERALLALLCVAAREPLVRATAATTLAMPVGSVAHSKALEEAIGEQYRDHFSPGVQARISRNLLSSWTQSGHLAGARKKKRVHLMCGPAATTYALLLGYLCGVRGTLLFETFWAQLLDAPASTLDTNAFAAAQRGWLEYRRVGNVADIGFEWLMKTEAGNEELAASEVTTL